VHGSRNADLAERGRHHVRRTSFYVEFKPDKTKEEPAPEVKDVDFNDKFPFEKPVPVPERGRVLNRWVMVRSRK